MATNEKLKGQLQQRANNAPQKPVTPEQTIAAYLKKMGPQIEKALPSHMKAERLGRIALTTIRTNPKLLECNVPSLLGAVMQSAQLGLEPGLMGHCYIIPYGKEATFIIGYKGMIDLARRSGHIESIYAHTVHEKDEFDYELGLNPKLVHKPASGHRGKMIYAYAVAHFKDGGYQFEVMDVEEIEKRRKRSKASKHGPWVTDYEEMAKKTVIRHMWKYLPISVEIQQQATQDEVIRKDVTSEPEFASDIIDVDATFEEDDIPTPDPAPEQPNIAPTNSDLTEEEMNDLFKSNK